MKNRNRVSVSNNNARGIVRRKILLLLKRAEYFTLLTIDMPDGCSLHLHYGIYYVLHIT